MPALTSYSNTENSALVVLKEKGYQLWYDQETETHFAEKDGWDFAAEGAMELLGVVALYEHCSPEKFEPYWWRKDDTKLLHNLSEEPCSYTSVTGRKF